MSKSENIGKVSDVRIYKKYNSQFIRGCNGKTNSKIQNKAEATADLASTEFMLPLCHLVFNHTKHKPEQERVTALFVSFKGVPLQEHHV